MVSISGLGIRFRPLDDERRYAIDDGVSAAASGADEAQIFQAQIPVAGWAGELGDYRCVEFKWGRRHGVCRFRFQVSGFRRQPFSIPYWLLPIPCLPH
jgi:hypothetical protein